MWGGLPFIPKVCFTASTVSFSELCEAAQEAAVHPLAKKLSPTCAVFSLPIFYCVFVAFIYDQIKRFPLGATPALLLVPPCTPQTSRKKCCVKAYLLIHSSVSCGPPPPTHTHTNLRHKKQVAVTNLLGCH